MKLAYADAKRYIADPEAMDVPLEALLSKVYAAGRRALIGERASVPEPGSPLRGDTVYLCAADADGMMVRLIESTFSGFGSGIVVPGRHRAKIGAAGFAHPATRTNWLRATPYHIIIPGFLARRVTGGAVRRDG
jgi:gamma-glutamyltranspeptidase/glutathione hydrolase